MLYIHIPFCKSRCIYCDFFSTTQGASWMERYHQALLREMDARRQEILQAGTDTVYLGGGTPSQLPPAILCSIFDAIDKISPLAAAEEITIEANPDDVTAEWLSCLRDTPVNRISMGVQTLDDALLGILRRRHTSSQALDAVDRCRRAGLENISLDLMYGLPTQTMAMWERDVATILSLGVPHLSAYSLQREEGTVMDSLMSCGQLSEADEELSLQMYQTLLSMTSAAGMQHYEISNFSLPGWHSRHNSGYWQDHPYVGLGPGAHSFDGNNIRRWNESDLSRYCLEAEVPHGQEILTPEEHYNEKVLTRLRTSEGLPLNILTETEHTHTMSVAMTHIRRGVLQLNKGSLCLTKQGIFTSNDIMSDFML